MNKKELFKTHAAALKHAHAILERGEARHIKLQMIENGEYVVKTFNKSEWVDQFPERHNLSDKQNFTYDRDSFFNSLMKP